MKLYKVTFSTGKKIWLRKPTMQDQRIATQEIEMQGVKKNPFEQLLKYIIVKAQSATGVHIEVGQPPVDLDKILGNSLQEYMELLQKLDNSDIIFDLKKKADLEVEEVVESSSPS